jgi:hypothetical protein
MQTITAGPSGPILGPSLAMIKEPTFPRYSQRVRNQQQSSMGDSFQMLSEPSLPPNLPRPKPEALADSAAKRTVDLVQGMSKLSNYIQVADSQHHETQPGEEDKFVDAFIRGLSDKRNRQKCEKKFKQGAKTWDKVKECFPNASQLPKSSKKEEEVGSEKAIREKGQRVDAAPAMPTVKERVAIEPGIGQDERQELPPMFLAAKSKKSGKQQTPKTAIAQIEPPTPFPRQRDNQAKPDKRKAQAANPSPPAPPPAPGQNAAQPRTAVVAERIPLMEHVNANRAGQPPTPVRAAQKRAPVEQDDGRTEERLRAQAPAKKRRTTEGERRQQRPPSIPILPSSDDEFA